MRKLKELYSASYFSYLTTIFATRFLPSLCAIFKKSGLFSLWLWFNEKIVKSKPVKFFFDTEFLSGIFYKSFFYRISTKRIRKASFHIPKASLKFDCFYIGGFIAAVLLLPQRLWSDFFWVPLFGAVALLYISRNIRERTGTVFVLVNTILLFFLAIIELALPHSTIAPLVYMLLGIDLFFLISFSVKTLDDLGKILFCLFVSAIILCGIGIFQNTASLSDAKGVFMSGVNFGEVLILIFPFAFLYPLEYQTGKRRWLYIGFLFLFFFNVVAATHSKSAFIGFLIELSIFVIADIKYIPFLVFLMPFGLGSVIDNIRYTWHTTTTQGDPLSNIINLGRQIWHSGFGVNSQKFLDLYTSSQFRTPGENTVLKIPYLEISPIYLNFIIDLGALLMFIFMFYVLRLAHSAFTSLFVADKKYRRSFTAGLATLVGISVSSFFEINFFSSRILLIYWAMLGILRSIRIISLGQYES